MKFNFFGKEFYFFATQEQLNKFLSMVGGYVLQPAILVALCLLVSYCAFLIYFKKRQKWGQYFYFRRRFILVAFYCVCAFTLLNRTERYREVVWLVPAAILEKGFHESMVLVFALNSCLYAPLGYFLMRYKPNIAWCYHVTVILSVGIEILQYVFALGMSMPVEVCSAVIGVSFGIIAYMWRHKRNKKDLLYLYRKRLYE